MPEGSPDGHSQAMRYVNDILGLAEDPPTKEELSPSSEELDLLEECFFSRSLEKLIASGGDKLLREVDLVDDDSGDRFKIRFEVLKLSPLAAHDIEELSQEMKLEYDLINWRKRAEYAEAQNKELLDTIRQLRLLVK